MDSLCGSRIESINDLIKRHLLDMTRVLAESRQRMTMARTNSFGGRLREIRKARGLTLVQVATAMTERGRRITQQAVSDWENEKYGTDRATAELLEEVLNAPGELTPTLGFGGEGYDSLSERVDRLSAEVAEIRRLVELVIERPPQRRRRKGPEGE